MANSNKDGLAGSIAGELHIGVQGPPGPVGPQGPVGPVGPEATPLTVTISGTAASHSASEIIAAIKAEKIVEVNMGTERLQVTAWDESAVTVTCKKAPAPNRSGALLSCNEYTISDSKTVTVVANSAISNKFTAKAGQVVAVANADPGGPTGFKAIDVREEFIATYGTTTFAEIWDAMRANKAVYCKNGNVTLPMTVCRAQSLVAEFGGVTESGNVVWKVKNATWSSDVLVDEDKFVAEYGVTTYREIYSAMQEGKSVFCKNGYYEFPMVKFTAPSWTAYFGGMADGLNVTFKVQDETWSSYNAETGGGGSDYVLPVGGDQLGGVKNGGNVVINADGTMTAPESSGGTVELDTTLTQSGKAADAKAVGDKIAEITGISLVEPADDDIPKVFYGAALPQTKTDTVMPFRYISKTADISCYCETKAQGNSSMSYAKKNQTTKLYADEACEEKLKVDFKGWGKQRKFCFKANWIDLSHARNVVSARLWADVVKSRSNYAELPELLRTSPNQGAVDGFPVKVYAAGVYQGRYTLNIPKDAWTFNMDDELDEHCVLCGEGYVSGCFREASVSQWTDEIHDSMPSTIKTRWIEIINFVMNSTDEEFKACLSDYFYVDSLIDYYLFALASCGLDAFGKNQIYATYDGQKWIASMYDMDSTWGLYWDGSKFVDTDYARTSYEDFVSTASSGEGNLLYIRLEQLFYEELQTRWAELKSGALSIENIINRFERFTDIAPAELVKEDYASTTGGGKFTGIPSQTTNNIQQIRAFALARQAWTDEYVAGLTPEEQIPCTGITLSASELTFTAEGTQTLTATVTPDGCTDSVRWVSDSVSIATVNNGVVTAIANGSTVITAYCGEYSASCTVSVSGIAEPIPCTGITLDKTELSFTEEGSQTITATVTPSDTTDEIEWVSDNTAIATVENGVVTPVADGSAVITATCGSQSATCTVTVSGVKTVLMWTDTPTYNIDTTTGEVVSGDRYVSDLFNIEKGYRYRFEGSAGNGLWGALATYNDDGTLAAFVGESNGIGTYVRADVFDTGTVGKARLAIAPKNGAVDLTECVLENDGFMSLKKYRINKTTGTVETGTNSVSLRVFAVDGGAKYSMQNANGGTATWKGVAEYAQDGAFIKFSEGGNTTDAYEVTLDANTALVRLSAFDSSTLVAKDTIEFVKV